MDRETLAAFSKLIAANLRSAEERNTSETKDSYLDLERGIIVCSALESSLLDITGDHLALAMPILHDSVGPSRANTDDTAPTMEELVKLFLRPPPLTVLDPQVRPDNTPAHAWFRDIEHKGRRRRY